MSQRPGLPAAAAFAVVMVLILAVHVIWSALGPRVGANWVGTQGQGARDLAVLSAAVGLGTLALAVVAAVIGGLLAGHGSRLTRIGVVIALGVRAIGRSVRRVVLPAMLLLIPTVLLPSVTATMS
ncbi:MAG: hypothetical protein Q4G40_09095, partial [Brachybacterium sp.]|nr:hypothetical protein [Brachybacterium sp.]